MITHNITIRKIAFALFVTSLTLFTSLLIASKPLQAAVTGDEGGKVRNYSRTRQECADENRGCNCIGSPNGFYCPGENDVAPGTTRPAGDGTTTTNNSNNLFGKINPPPGIANFSVGPEGLGNFIGVILRVLVVAAGVYALINFIFAGYQFMTAGGDPKGVETAWGKIWQSLLGLVIVASSFLLAAVIGQLLFGDAAAILSPKLFLP